MSSGAASYQSKFAVSVLDTFDFTNENTKHVRIGSFLAFADCSVLLKSGSPLEEFVWRLFFRECFLAVYR